MADPAEERRQVLHYAAVNGRSDLISLAIEQEVAAEGAAFGAVESLLGWQNGEKGTALHEATRAGHVDVVRLLLLRGAPANARDTHGRSAYQVAQAEGAAEKFSQLRAAFEAELFKRCAEGDLAAAEALALSGVDLKADQAGYSPSAWAELFGQTEVARRMQELVAGEVKGESLEKPASEPEGSEEPAPEPVEPARFAELLLWPPVFAYVEAEVTLSGPKVTLRFPPSLGPESCAAEAAEACSLLEELTCSLQALEGELVPQLRSPGCPAVPAAEELLVDLWLEASQGPPNQHRLRVRQNHIDLTAGSVQALVEAAQDLRQLLKLHAARAATGTSPSPFPSLQLPGLCLASKARSSPLCDAAVFLDLWRLAGSERSGALRQLARWRTRFIWAPVLEATSLASIWQMRRSCSKLGMELLPILPKTVDIKLLAQFQGCSQVGCWSRDCTELEEVWQKMGAAGLDSKSRLAALFDLAAGMQAVYGLLEDISKSSIPPARFGVLLEISVADKKVWEVDAARSVQARGFPASLLVRSREALPCHIWHQQPAKGKASALAQLAAANVVLEVPVFGAPWAGPGTAWRPSWCLLSAFLATGAGDPEALQALTGASRLRLLCGQLFQDEKAPPEELATELWDVDGPSFTSLNFLRSLLDLLAGKLPQIVEEDRENCISSANACYAHLSERRQRLRELLEGRGISSHSHQASQASQASPDPLPESHMLLASALTGVEWLRFSCRLLLLLAKYSFEKHASSELKAALQALPPAKGSDVRNGFLSLLHQTSNDCEETPDSEVSLPLHVAKALWSGGLRLGTALELPPWDACASCACE